MIIYKIQAQEQGTYLEIYGTINGEINISITDGETEFPAEGIFDVNEVKEILDLLKEDKSNG